MAKFLSNVKPELSLRDELIELFDGNEFVPKRDVFIYRKRRMDDQYRTIECHCYNPISKEGKSDCPDCLGYGYYWDEEILIGKMWTLRANLMSTLESYKSYGGKVGRLDDMPYMIVFPFPIEMFEKDTIYTVRQDDDGYIKFPIIKLDEYYITETVRMGLDLGRKDFTLVSVTKK